MANFTKLQWGVLGSASILFFIMWIGGRTVPNQKKGAPTEEDQPIELTAEAILAGARNKLDSTQLQQLLILQQRQNTALSPSEEANALRELSSTWNKWGNFTLGGFYAEQKAAVETPPSAESWKIAGTTYEEALRQTQDPEVRKFAVNRAIQAFQKASELAPDSVSYQIYESLMWVELSLMDPTIPPMQGIQKLLALDKKYPNNININLSLGYLSLNISGAIDKAIPRFERVIALKDSMEVRPIDIWKAHSSLIRCYKTQQNKEKVLYHFDKCIELSPSESTTKKLVAAKEEYLSQN